MLVWLEADRLLLVQALMLTWQQLLLQQVAVVLVECCKVVDWGTVQGRGCSRGEEMHVRGEWQKRAVRLEGR